MVAIALAMSSQTSAAHDSERNGQTVVEAVCIKCHGAGVNGAPKIGDKKAWDDRATRSLTDLSQNALNGIRKMPPHGGNPALSDTEIKRAIVYMIDQSGGNWTEPLNKSAQISERSGEAVVHSYCARCHETGVGGAPRIGDRVAWTPRVKQGFDALRRSAINGNGGMHARGGEPSLTDNEIQAAIMYMWDPIPGKSPALIAAADRSDPNHHLVSGMDVYFGATPAESIRKDHPGSDAESTMHGGIPHGQDYYHLNISLLDHASKAEISDAHIEINIMDPVSGEQKKTLDPMALNGSVSYGNYFKLPNSYPHTVVVLIRRHDAVGSVETQFELRQ